jgi:hypothetical protein
MGLGECSSRHYKEGCKSLCRFVAPVFPCPDRHGAPLRYVSLVAADTVAAGYYEIRGLAPRSCRARSSLLGLRPDDGAIGNAGGAVKVESTALNTPAISDPGCDSQLYLGVRCFAEACSRLKRSNRNRVGKE